MAILRRGNFLSQERVDTSHLLSLESAVSNDFDTIAESYISGTSNSYVLNGFNISMASAIGGAASSLNMVVSGGALLHTQASQSGTFFTVPTGTPNQQLNSSTNSIVFGAFSPSSVNYVGIDYVRAATSATNATGYFWNVSASDETVKVVPQAIVLNYTINISSFVPASNILPIAIVVTDSGNNVTSIQDCRPMLFRLGQGGWNPNSLYTYSWPQGQVENAGTSTSNSLDPFFGGDKAILSQKQNDDAIKSLIQGIIGGTYWYSPNTSGSLNSIRQDLGNTLITGVGYIEHSATTAGLINWNDDIFVKVVGSSVSYKLDANPSSTDITLSDNQVAYVTLVRGQQVTPNLVFTNGSAIVNSVGSVSWTSQLAAGDWVKLGSDPDSNYYEILTVNSLTQVTLTSNYTGTSTGAGGAKALYSFGSYSTSPTPSSNRNIYIANRAAVPVGPDVFWLFMRSDNGGSPPRVYIRFLSTELSQGESEDISAPIPLQVLTYIGSPGEAAYAPQYATQVNPSALPQIQTIQVGAATTIAQNAYFVIYSSGNYRPYYVWFNKDGGGTDPTPANYPNAIPVAITSAQTAAQVATVLQAALNGTTFNDFSATAVSGHTDTIQVTNNSAGAAVSTANVTTTFTITQTQAGVGTGNFIVQDGDNLTLGIKKLDEQIALIEGMLDDPSYDETITIVASGEVPPSTVNGPVVSGTTLSLPLNSRRGNTVQKYTVGNGVLQFCLNGIRLVLGSDWLEVGSAGDASSEFHLLRQLNVLDVLKCEILVTGGIGGGGPSIPGPPGPTGPAGADALGGPFAISTKTSSYSILTSDCFLKGDATSGTLTFTLPPASSASGHVFYIKKIDSSVNPVIIAASGTDLIDGQSTVTESTQYQSLSLASDGATWSLF